jgi:hypothetical protein
MGDSFYEYLIKEHIYTEKYEMRFGRTKNFMNDNKNQNK